MSTSNVIPASEPHVAAVMKALRVGTPEKLRVELAVGPAGDAYYGPYAVVYPDGGGVYDGRLSAGRTHLFMVFLITAVGTGPEQCLWVVDKVRNAALNAKLEVPGRKVHRLTQDIFPSQMIRDWNSQAKGPTYQQFIEFELRSEPKP